MGYKVKIDVFEGPFDLLLQLITRQELDIHEVPISQITDAYIEQLERIQTIDLEVATEFLVIAATLMLLKIRSLLPLAVEEEFEDETSPESIRDGLIDQLIEYKKYANAAVYLAELYERERGVYRSLREAHEDFAYAYPDTFKDVAVEDLTGVLVEVLLSGMGAVVDTSHISTVDISVDEYMESLRDTLTEKDRIRFTELIQGCGQKIEIIATFLALLELFKRAEIELRQRKNFGDIVVISKEVGDGTGSPEEGK